MTLHKIYLYVTALFFIPFIIANSDDGFIRRRRQDRKTYGIESQTIVRRIIIRRTERFTSREYTPFVGRMDKEGSFGRTVCCCLCIAGLVAIDYTVKKYKVD